MAVAVSESGVGHGALIVEAAVMGAAKEDEARGGHFAKLLEGAKEDEFAAQVNYNTEPPPSLLPPLIPSLPHLLFLVLLFRFHRDLRFFRSHHHRRFNNRGSMPGPTFTHRHRHRCQSRRVISQAKARRASYFTATSLDAEARHGAGGTY